jgi:signal transduction histidine kinase/DNA-binding response OmpR family regulator
VERENLQNLDEYLFQYLREVMYAPSKPKLDLSRLPNEMQRFGKGLQFFSDCAVETASVTKALARGALSGPLPSRQNEMAAPLKSLHASLSHLTWQTKQVAMGDYTQRVDFMGEFSNAFNFMVHLLDERWKALEDLYRRNAAYVRLIHKIGENLLSIGDSGHAGAVINSLKDLCETFDYMVISLWRAGDEGERFERLFHWPDSGESILLTVQDDWLNDLSSGKYVSINPVTSWEGIFSQEVKSFLAIPLMVKGDFWGFIAMPGNEERTGAEEEISVVTASGILIVSAILAKEMTDSLVEAKEDALRATRVKSDFLSRMSHEMRTPMNAIIGMANIARGTDDKKKLQFCLSTIETSANHLLSLINDVLDLSKIEADKLQLDPAPFDMEKMLMKICNIIEEKVEQNNQTLCVVMEKGMSMGYIGDEMRLSQVVTNLFSNAVKFTPERGKILLTVEEVKSGENRGRLRFSVSDTGIGMSEEQMLHLFNPFDQADASIAKRYGGTGLGLAISKKIVERMNGLIEATSEPNRGSTFIFEVELERDPQWNGGAVSDGGMSGLRVLMAEDGDPNLQKQFRSVTDQSGITVDFAQSGGQAASLVSSAIQNEHPFDAIFIDCNLPDNGGIEAVRSFDPAVDRNTVVVMASFLKWNKIEREANEEGIYRYLSKPLFPSSIYNVINELQKGEPDEENVRNSGAQSNTEEGTFDFSGKRILLIDDVELNRMIVSDLLEDTNVGIDEAENGEQALVMFEESSLNYYDLVFMDILMPGMDGYETTRRIRGMTRPDAKTTPIIALTANAYKEDAEKALEAGMNGHLAKPIDIDEVRNLLAARLKNGNALKFRTGS